jgi:alpha-tubulin suppressor-like RCC1 family protein
MHRSTGHSLRNSRYQLAVCAAVVATLFSLSCGDSTEPRRAAALAIVTQPPSTAQSGVAFSGPVLIQVRDQKGATFAQSGITITASIGEGGGALGGATTVSTDANGSAAFSGLVLAGTIGTRTLRFTAPGLSGATSSSITLTPGAAAALEAQSATSVSATVGTGVTTLPSVVVKDASSNAVSGVTVTFAVASGGGTITGASQTSNASGVATLGGWTLPTAARQYTLTATATGVPGNGVTFTATATPDVPSTMETSGGGQALLYGSRLPTPVQVRVADKYGNPTPGVVVTWGSFVGAGTVEPIGVTTDADGIVRSNYRLGTMPGENAIRASINSLGLHADIAATALGFTNELDISSHHTCALDESGAAYCWGLNDYGQLGDRTTVRQPSPTRVFGTLRFRRISTGWGVTCALTTDDVPYCWGLNTYGQLGDGTRTHRMQPTPVAGGYHFTEISVAQDASCGVTGTGAAYCWGSNQTGQLGVGTNVQMETCTDPLNPSISFACSLVPMPVVGGHAFSSITVGSFHACGLTSAASELYCWGLGWTYGSQGSGNGSSDPTPVRVAPSYTFEKVVAGGSITCAIDAPSSAYCWGSGSRGALGNGTIDAFQATPGLVPDLAATDLDADFGVCAVAADARAFCWGFNLYGAVGDGTTTDRTFATAVASAEKFTKVAASGRHTCGRTDKGQVYCWGESSNGALGTGDYAQHLTPALARP